jgi:hypothetical protein
MLIGCGGIFSHNIGATMAAADAVASGLAGMLALALPLPLWCESFQHGRCSISSLFPNVSISFVSQSLHNGPYLCIIHNIPSTIRTT